MEKNPRPENSTPKLREQYLTTVTTTLQLARNCGVPETTLRRRLYGAGITGDVQIDLGRRAFSRKRADLVREWNFCTEMAAKWKWVGAAYDGKSIHEYSQGHDPAKVAEAAEQAKKFETRAAAILSKLNRK